MLNLDRNQHSRLAQLRTGVLPLHVETGRFENKKLKLKNAKQNMQKMFYCSYYDNLRRCCYDDIVIDEIEDEAWLNETL